MSEAVYSVDEGGSQSVRLGGEEGSPSVRELAIQWGWVPREEFKGNPEKFVDYAEFVQAEREVTKNLKKHISMQERKIETLNREMEELRSRYERSTKSQQNDILKQLDREWREAVEEGDVTRATELRDQLFELKAEAVREVDTGSSREAEERAIFKEWQANNEWFGRDEDKTIYAEGLFATFQKDGQYTKPLDEILDLIAEKVSKKFDGVAEGGDRKNASTALNADVGSGRPSGSLGKTRFTYNDLTERQKKICNDFIKDKTFKTRQEYVDSLVEAGVLS